MPRLFAGIEISSDVAAHLKSLCSGLRNTRWIDPENYHIPLRFIGDIDDDTAEDIYNLFGSVRRTCFSLSLDGLGSFGVSSSHAVWSRVVA